MDHDPHIDSAKPSRRRSRTAADVRERRRRILRYALLLVSAVLMVNALVGDKGYLATIQARQEQARLQSALANLERDNARLLDEARRLRSDPRTLEEAAREDLGLIKPGETLITIRDRPRAQ